MFCEFCGTKLPELSGFCPECGRKIKENNSSINELKLELTVKPFFNSKYISLRLLVAFGGLILFLSIIATILIGIKVGMGLFIVNTIILCIIIPLKIHLDKAMYESCSFDFYNTKVIYNDTFLGGFQKEVKYKYIKEINMKQTCMQRIFDLGNIVFLTDTEIGNAIDIRDCKDVKNVYNKLKDIIGI